MLSERDNTLRRIRPQIQSDSQPSEIRDEGTFQTLVLRPILKFQNGIIVAQFRQYIIKFKPAFNAYSGQVQKNYIQDVLKSDPRIKNSLIASVVSVMTLNEYSFYCANKNECNKRIVMLITKRLQDNLELLF